MVKSYRLYPGLECFVKSIVITHYHLDKNLTAPVNPFPPQPYQTLYFYPYDKVSTVDGSGNVISELAASTIVGPQLNRISLRLGYNALVIIVTFKPGALHRLLKIPMHELIDMPLDASHYAGRELVGINEQLSGLTEYGAMAVLVQKYLSRKANDLKDALPVDRALQSITPTGAIMGVGRLADLSCVSTRQLERQFNERIGMSPKLYFRLDRFSRAWRMRENCTGISWSAIAHQCGYADQMHMIRDFKEFTGATPGSLQTELSQTHLRLQRDGFDI
ncbi:MAG: AraC family transcriptional regulator [Bacteroidetes bacterium]|nr:AraC family transcriptional regulator [Bacteroidota bacterium]